ncbi:MAG: zinc-dependent metalloprotease [Propionibacteriaceae bacterium]|jgi:coenzyme F420 biosynthesis associated uncharacterized protein|nr:zinc-dependent metalloprotease [Propionibacteriaceae bacterium]
MSDSWIDWDVVRNAARRATRPGGKASQVEIRQAVAELHACAEQAIDLVAGESHLPVAAHARVWAVDRPSIVDANIDNLRYMFAESGVDEVLGGALGALSAKASGVATGVALAAITGRVLGQFIPFGARPALYLVVPNIMKCEHDLGVDPSQFRLWVCLHEQTHQAQFGRASWLPAYLTDMVSRAAASEIDEQGSLSELWEQLGALVRKANDGKTSMDRFIEKAPPEVAEALQQATAVMSLLEGHADVMMDAVGPTVIPDLANIRAKFTKRRAKGGWSATVTKLMGMDAKMAQYKDGAVFCRAVIDARGIDVLNLAFEGPATLPSIDELRNPDAWIERVAPPLLGDVLGAE